MPTVCSLTKLRLLDLSNTAITDWGVSLLAPLRSLRDLGIYGTKITDESAKTIGDLTNLEILNANHTRITDAGLRHLAKLRGLCVIELLGTDVAQDGIAAFRQSVRGCLVRTDYGLFEPLIRQQRTTSSAGRGVACGLETVSVLCGCPPSGTRKDTRCRHARGGCTSGSSNAVAPSGYAGSTTGACPGFVASFVGKTEGGSTIG